MCKNFCVKTIKWLVYIQVVKREQEIDKWMKMNDGENKNCTIHTHTCAFECKLQFFKWTCRMSQRTRPQRDGLPITVCHQRWTFVSVQKSSVLPGKGVRLVKKSQTRKGTLFRDWKEARLPLTWNWHSLPRINTPNVYFYSQLPPPSKNFFFNTVFYIKEKIK